MPAEVKPDTSKKDLGKRVKILTIMSACLFITLLLLLFALSQHVQEYTRLVKERPEKEELIASLSERVNNMTDTNESNERDLIAYIKIRHPSVPKELAALIAERLNVSCKVYRIAFPLAVGLMEVESRFNPFVTSQKGAKGLFQVMHSVWGKELKIDNPSDLHGIGCGVDSGLQVLKSYIDKNNGNITKALQNYNGTKGNEFHELVYEKVGRFTAFRTNQYGKEEEDTEAPPDAKEEVNTDESAVHVPPGSTEVPEELRNDSNGK